MDQERASDAPGLNLPFTDRGQGEGPPRLPFLDRLSNSNRNHFVACLGEFIGTFFFLFLALSGAQVATVNNDSPVDEIPRVLYISLAFGFSLAVNVWVMYRVSGGLFNPAVTIGMCLVSAVDWMRGLYLIISQILAAIVSSFVVKAIFPGPLSLTKLNSAANIGPVQGFFIELFLTFVLVLSIMMMAAEKHAATHLAPVGIGLALFAAELSGVYYTGGSLNPARSFGPAVAAGDFSGGHYVFWLGPIVGAVAAALLYKLLKMLEYEKANPGQDDRGKNGGIQI